MIIKITLEDFRTKAIYHHFSFLINLEQFEFLGKTPRLIDGNISIFTEIGYALQAAIRSEKREEALLRKREFNHAPEETLDLVTLVYVTTPDLKKFALGYQQKNQLEDLNDIIRITEINLSTLAARFNQKISSLLAATTATVRRRSTDGVQDAVTLSYAEVDAEFPKVEIGLVDHIAKRMLDTEVKSTFYGMKGFLRVKLHPKSVYKKLVNEEGVDTERLYALYPQAQIDWNEFTTQADAKLEEVATKISGKKAKIQILKAISADPEPRELIPVSPIWNTFVTTNVGPAIRLLSGQVNKLEGLTVLYNQVRRNDFTAHLTQLAGRCDEYQTDIFKVKNELARNIQFAILQIWTWMTIKLNYEVRTGAIDYFQALFGDFCKIKTIDGKQVLQFEDVYQNDFGTIKKYNDLLLVIAKANIHYQSEKLHEIMVPLMNEVKETLRKLQIRHDNDIIFEVTHSNSNGFQLSDEGFQKQFTTEISYDSTVITTKTTTFNNQVDTLLAEQGTDPLMNSFESIVEESKTVIADIKEIKSLSDALGAPVRENNTLMTSAVGLFTEVKREVEQLSADAERAGVDFTEVKEAQASLSELHSQLNNISSLININFAAITTADSLLSAKAASDVVHSYVTPPPDAGQNQFQNTLSAFITQAAKVRELNLRNKVSIEQKIMDNHYIDTVLKYKSFLEDQLDYWHKNTSQFLCIGGTRAIGSHLKVPRGIADQIKVVYKYGAHNLDGARARRVWERLQKVSRDAEARKTGIGLFYFNLRKDAPSRLYQMTASQYDINSQVDVSFCLRQINNEWRYIPKATGLSVTENGNPFSEENEESLSKVYRLGA